MVFLWVRRRKVGIGRVVLQVGQDFRKPSPVRQGKTEENLAEIPAAKRILQRLLEGDDNCDSQHQAGHVRAHKHAFRG